MRQSQVDVLQAALVECQRFVKAAKLALERHEEFHAPPVKNQHYVKNVAASLAATKRASMDLTLALARFRRA